MRGLNRQIDGLPFCYSFACLRMREAMLRTLLQMVHAPMYSCRGTVRTSILQFPSEGNGAADGLECQRVLDGHLHSLNLQNGRLPHPDFVCTQLGREDVADRSYIECGELLPNGSTTKKRPFPRDTIAHTILGFPGVSLQTSCSSFI